MAGRMSKNDLRQKRYAKDGKGQAERRLPAEYDCLAALVRLAGLLYGRAHTARQTRQAYQDYFTNMVRLNDPAADDETHDVAEEELESSRSLWIKLGEPIWRDALTEFPLRGVPGAVALRGTGKGVLIKFEDAGELLEAALAVDECLRFVAKKAAEKARLPFTLPLSAFVAPRIQIMPDGHSRIAQDLLHDAILPALAAEISGDRRQPDGPDVRRLKICTVCDRLFVAKRHDQTSCSGQCANTHRQRRFRNRDKRREYKEHHRKNQLAKAARARWRAERMLRDEQGDS
jgi:hypothetical protein